MSNIDLNNDEFQTHILEVITTKKSLLGLNNFMNVAEDRGVDIHQHIIFLGEYQKLLYDKLFLNISFLISDKPNNNSKSKMQEEIDDIQKMLKSDIKGKRADDNFSVIQKEEILKELVNIRNNKEYQTALKQIHTMRNKRVAHQDNNFDFSKLKLNYNMIELVVNHIQRLYEIRQLVKYNIGVVNINGIQDYDHANIVEAIVLHNEIKNLKFDFEMNSISKGEMNLYNDTVDFFNEQIKSLYIKEGLR